MGLRELFRGIRLLRHGALQSRLGELWREQETERSARARALETESRWPGKTGPAAYPPPEQTFASYPTRRLDGADRLLPVAGSSDRVDALLAMPLTNHAAGRRVLDPQLLRSALALAPCSIDDLDRYWNQHGVERGLGRSSVAWMLKYDLVRASDTNRPAGGPDP